MVGMPRISCFSRGAEPCVDHAECAYSAYEYAYYVHDYAYYDGMRLLCSLLPNSERCKVSSIGQDLRAHRCHRRVRSAAGEIRGGAVRCRRPLFFLKPTSKVEKKCRRLHTLTTSMSKTQ